MARISIDPTKIKTAPKFRSARIRHNWPPHHFLGFLCALWGTIVDNNESGEISDWTPEYMAEVVGIGNVDPNELWETLVECGYIEERDDGRVLVKDWIEIAGTYLDSKYHGSDRGRQLCANIWSLHGQIYRGKAARPDSSQEETSRPPKGSLKADEPNSAKNRRISDPGESPSRPSPKDNDSSSAFSPSWETEGEKAAQQTSSNKSLVGFSAPETTEKPTAAVTLLQRTFEKKLAETLGEVPAGFNYGAAGKNFKRLLEQGWGVQEIENRMDAWFQSTDAFIVKRGFRVEDFPTYFNRLKDGPIANQVGTNARQPFYDGAATVTEEAGANY